MAYAPSAAASAMSGNAAARRCAGAAAAAAALPSLRPTTLIGARMRPVPAPASPCPNRSVAAAAAAATQRQHRLSQPQQPQQQRSCPPTQQQQQQKQRYSVRTAAGATDVMPTWTLDQIAGIFFGGVMVAVLAATPAIDGFIARQQRRQLGLCERCGGVNEAATCGEAACPLRAQRQAQQQQGPSS